MFWFMRKINSQTNLTSSLTSINAQIYPNENLKSEKKLYILYKTTRISIPMHVSWVHLI